MSTRRRNNAAQRAEEAGSEAGSEVDEPTPKPDRKKLSIEADILKRRTLFIRGLPFTSTSESLSEKFSFVAPLKHATIVQDPNTKESRGFGFVTFTDAEDAQKAIKQLHGKDFEGRKLKVELAEPRHRQDPSAAKPKEEIKKRAPRLIVRNLPWSVKKPEQLVKVFQSHGKVTNVIIPTKRNGEQSGFAFVTMKGYKNAERAIEAVNGKEIDKRTIAVDWAVEKSEWEETVSKGMPAAEKVVSEDEEEGGAALDSDEEDVAEDGEGRSEEEEGEEEEAVLEDPAEDDGEEMNDEGMDGEMDDEGMDGEMNDEDMDMDEEDDHSHRKPTDSTTTLFIRNLPFSTTDESLNEHFTQFGPVRYARIVMDHSTDRPKGTGFVAFYNAEDCDKCIRSAPSNVFAAHPSSKPSLLQDEGADPLYTLDGRTLSITRAVDRSEASRLETTSAATREKATSDRRRLFLLKEGNIPASSPTWQHLSTTERSLREQSVDQRKKLLAADPNLHLSLTRLSVRNIPRWVTGTDLKAFARSAIPGFMDSVTAGTRAPLNREELFRDGAEGKDAEAARREKGKGVVKQAKIQLEKVGGRSRGYGFIEYYSHRFALMGLRYLNGLEIPGVPPTTPEEADEDEVAPKGKGKTPRAPRRPTVVPAGEEPERKKRLIVEFAIENSKVINRRKDLENRSREISKKMREEGVSAAEAGSRKRKAEDEEIDLKKAGAGKGPGGKGFGKGKKPKTDKKPIVKHKEWNKKAEKKPKVDARRGKGGFKKD